VSCSACQRNRNRRSRRHSDRLHRGRGRGRGRGRVSPLFPLGNDDGCEPALFDADKTHGTDRCFPRWASDVAQSSQVGSRPESRSKCNACSTQHHLSVPFQGERPNGRQCSLVRSNGAGIDERGRLPLDQLLAERLSRDPNPVGDIGEFQLAKKVKQGRLIKTHRVLCPSVRSLIGSH